jgi:aspartate/methionine/tyrosine aminotransferase
MFASRTNWRLEPNRLAAALERHRHSGRELIDLTSSNSTTCGFVYPEREILRALANSRVLAYSPESKGLLEARQAVAEYYDELRGFTDSGTGVDPERIVLLSGTSEGYSHIFRLLCEPGDEILVPAPSYPLFEFLADLNDVSLTTYPLIYDHGWHMDLRALQGAFTPRTRAVMVVHPNNPTGSFVKAGEATELAKLCAAQGAAIVADEVFLDYPSSEMNLTAERLFPADAGAPGASAARTNLTAERPLPRASAARTFARGTSDALTFTLSGLSKICALPQMKLAWIVVNGPEELARGAIERLDVIADTYLSPGTPVQLAARELLALRPGVQTQIRARVAANLAYLDGALQGSSLTRLACEGGWYAVLRAPSVGSDEAQATELIERCSVLVHPGQFFNFAQDGYLVLSLISPGKDFAEGCRRLRQSFD